MTVRLDGIDLVIFDKDGTLIDFAAMWSGWAVGLAHELGSAAGRSVDGPLYAMLGFEPESGTILPGGGLAASPMALLRDRTHAVLVGAGLSVAAADRALAAAWRAPDPVALARPLADLPFLFESLRAAGRRIAISTSDDRQPTERTLAALGLAGLVDAIACADDGLAVKPAGDTVVHLCRALGTVPGRAAVVGDAPADLRMGRAAGAALVIGVLSGVGARADLEPLADDLIATVAELAPS